MVYHAQVKEVIDIKPEYKSKNGCGSVIVFEVIESNISLESLQGMVFAVYLNGNMIITQRVDIVKQHGDSIFSVFFKEIRDTAISRGISLCIEVSVPIE